MPIYIFLAVFFFCLIMCIIHRKPDKTDLLVWVTTFYLGFTHIRHSVFFGLVSGSYLALILNENWETWKKKRLSSFDRPWMPQSILIALLIALYLLINPSLSIKGSPSFLLLTSSPHYPTGAYRWIINSSFKGNILPHFEWGEFLIWYFYPSCRVAMDGRYETVYQEQFSNEYFLFLNGREGGQHFLKKYPHDMILIKANSEADLLLRKNPAWEKVYMDSTCVVYLSKKFPSRNAH